MRWHTALILVFIVLASAACKDVKKTPINAMITDSLPRDLAIDAANMAGSFSPQTALKLDSLLLDSFFIRYPHVISFSKSVRTFYANRKFAYAWYDANGQIEQAGHLHNRIENLPEEGITDGVPYKDALDSLMAAPDPNDRKIQAETELMLTSLYFYFAERVWTGVSESTSKKIEWLLPRKKISYEAWLDSLLKTPGGFAQAGEPVYRQYNLLKSFLKKYKDLGGKASWTALKEEKKSLRLGDSSAAIGEIRKRLLSFGDLSGAAESNLFDVDLEAAVKNFQRRFGLRQDGIIGLDMIRELNVPMEKRAQQISVNLERSRWLPDAVKGDYLAVNIPEFMLHAYKDDSLIWDMNVVVGKSIHKTVIFSGDLQYVVFSPYWNVPPSILKNEVLPGIRKNKNYLAAHNMEWNGNGVRQKPGPGNSLGKVKFLFPNTHNIYLHDTPSKNLFNEDSRAFSHGCIRVAEPFKLAAYLLRNDPAWDDQKINAAMNKGKEQYVTLKKTVPVFITYLTAWVDRRGEINFRKDIYGRDNRLYDMMSGK